ncbi:hypothetical protein [Epilithonimonas hispanica]|uniref:DUF4352 domain-containing protein n=1 Tax=Epilithonimonas hispanica TaxID=358687 RepID=A0A3D9D013_9FLAO|nr:hypothetical protein [Epilithonimonas hispanica]REC71359.1 hypothetical protein DRF58_05965 [Epilithonimonas hispanica]
MKKILLFITALILLSCSNPMNKPYNEETLQTDLKEIVEKKKMSEEDSKTFAGWLILAKLGDKNLKGKTYQEILDEAKNYKKEQEELELKAKAEEKAKADKMQKAATISIFEYNFVPADSDNYEYQDYHLFKYAIKNKSNKEIKALKFHFKIYNALGDEIGDGYEISLTDDRVSPNAIYRGYSMFNSNSYNSDDNKISNANFKDLKFDIITDKIVYTDGSVLE